MPIASRQRIFVQLAPSGYESFVRMLPSCLWFVCAAPFCVQASAESSITWILVNPCGAAKAVSHSHIASAKAEFSCNVLLISVQRKLYHRVHGAKVFNFSKSVSPFYNRYPHLNINPGVLTTENIHRDLQ